MRNDRPKRTDWRQRILKDEITALRLPWWNNEAKRRPGLDYTRLVKETLQNTRFEIILLVKRDMSHQIERLACFDSTLMHQKAARHTTASTCFQQAHLWALAP
jgi:hypothetical protein